MPGASRSEGDTQQEPAAPWPAEQHFLPSLAIRMQQEAPGLQPQSCWSRCVGQSRPKGEATSKRLLTSKAAQKRAATRPTAGKGEPGNIPVNLPRSTRTNRLLKSPPGLDSGPARQTGSGARAEGGAPNPPHTRKGPPRSPEAGPGKKLRRRAARRRCRPHPPLRHRLRRQKGLGSGRSRAPVLKHRLEAPANLRRQGVFFCACVVNARSGDSPSRLENP